MPYRRYSTLRKHKTTGSKPVVLLDFGDWELTLREAIFAFLIVGVMTAIGYFVALAIEQRVHAKQLEYRQAAQIENSEDEFKLALETDIGNAFVEADLKAVDKVKHEKLHGEWLAIDASYEKYTMHTRVVHYTVTDSKGRSHTRSRTETYWTWDRYDREQLKAKQVNFSGVIFPTAKFDLGWCSRHEDTVSIGWHKRIVFNTVPAKMHGTVFTKLADKTVSDCTPFWKDQDLKTAYEECISSYAVVIFWSIWIAVTIGLLIAFFVIENDWLEDR